MPQLILFNKPYGILTQFTGELSEQTLSAFIKFPGFYAAGRLDKQSEGLLILTDDGKLQHRLTHPKFDKKKYYWVQVEGAPTDNDLQPLRKGLVIKDITFLPAEAKLISEPKIWSRIPPIRERKNIPTTWLEIILREGKNHQIRKMTAAIGFPTLRLIRHRIGDWQLDELKPGEYKLINLINDKRSESTRKNRPRLGSKAK
ncbi:TPA: pseudouridine synthase [Legionella pneumophila]|nr:pseudouridine synthase [Legionella pneumophila]HBC0463732.1 pseudouridine synthase [Legionella pneumophila]HBC0466168.1 pseudouridine synthase [Legionella pneumophila]HBD9374131.1 pseudouridine synthase [Legionella pneumophila]HBI2945226.1 pseudouridine synthase [Legionella pneumophila]HDV6632328.1 pseudouridine synthase [Legionella pneumophila]